LRTFLISIAVNHARHYVRSAARRRAAVERLALVPAAATPQDPERSFQQAELAQLLSAGLDTLSLEQRVAFVLCEVEERNSREAAAIVGVPEATVRTRLFHAKRKLRAFLEKRGLG
jgi:RNA polymerase sigma-70 factor (ECF subfamily)